MDGNPRSDGIESPSRLLPGMCTPARRGRYLVLLERGCPADGGCLGGCGMGIMGGRARRCYYTIS